MLAVPSYDLRLSERDSAGEKQMDPASDERVQRLNEQIQQEQDPRKLAQLVEELMRVLDEFSSPRDGHRRQAS